MRYALDYALNQFHCFFLFLFNLSENINSSITFTKGWQKEIREK